MRRKVWTYTCWIWEGMGTWPHVYPRLCQQSWTSLFQSRSTLWCGENVRTCTCWKGEGWPHIYARHRQQSRASLFRIKVDSLMRRECKNVHLLDIRTWSHIYTPHCLYLGLPFFKQGRPSDAQAMFIRALSGYEKVLGPTHPATLKIIHTLHGLSHQCWFWCGKHAIRRLRGGILGSCCTLVVDVCECNRLHIMQFVSSRRYSQYESTRQYSSVGN